MRFALIALLLVVSTSSFAGSKQPTLAAAQPSAPVATFEASSTREESNPNKEIGLTVGTPAALNVSAGFWGTAGFPILVRASGMFYGDKVRGFQGDLGWAFKQAGSWRHYVAASFMTMKINTTSNYLYFQGIGPVYGFNLYGFSFQTGLSFGISDDNASLDLFSIRKITAPQLTLQLGYTFMF